MKTKPMIHRAPHWLLVLGLVTGFARAENWPAWRGLKGTGICPERGLPLHWGTNENIRWRTPLPDRGNSTPIIWGDRVFITQAIQKEQRRTLQCFDRSNGKLLWQSGVIYSENEAS